MIDMDFLLSVDRSVLIQSLFKKNVSRLTLGVLTKS